MLNFIFGLFIFFFCLVLEGKPQELGDILPSLLAGLLAWFILYCRSNP